MERAIICFTRVPIPGQTKTRMMPFLSPLQCAQLHEAILRDIAGVCGNVCADLFLAFTPVGEQEALRAIFPSVKEMIPQSGKDLGERMHNALCHVLALGYQQCLLIGADIPLLTPGHLEAAFQALDSADVTLGPVNDGGYYLVGMRKPCPVLFENQTYGSGSVFDRTVAAAQSAGLTVIPAPGTMDADTPEDLQALRHQLQEGHTARFLQQLFQEVVK